MVAARPTFGEQVTTSARADTRGKHETSSVGQFGHSVLPAGHGHRYLPDYADHTGGAKHASSRRAVAGSTMVGSASGLAGARVEVE